MTIGSKCVQRVGRRAFLQHGTLLISATAIPVPASLSSLCHAGLGQQGVLNVGIMTDLHYADKEPAGTRFYRETPRKLDEAISTFAGQPLDFVVELGDLIDAAEDVETELGYLSRINQQFAKISKDRHYVLGNHCVYTLTKDEFLGEVEQESSYYSFDRGGVHFVIIDSCFRSDGTPYQRRNFQWTDPNVPEDELEWLRSDLDQNKKPTIVFAHQRFDVANNHGVKNAKKVREIFESTGNVVAVFQGHSHQNDLKEIAGIPYCTLVAMVEGSGLEKSGFGVIEVDSLGNLKLQGFRQQKNRAWEVEN